MRNFYPVLILVLILLVTACVPQKPDESTIQTAIAETDEAMAALATPTSVPTDVPTKTPTEKPTLKPTKEPTKTPKATKTTKPTSTPEEEAVEKLEDFINDRFVLPHPDNTGYIDSDLADETWTETMDSLARNQAIPKPYEWQLVEMPDSTRWADIYDYYKKALVSEGWSITSDGGSWITLAHGNTMYVGGFIKDYEGKKEKISILFYPVTKNYKCHYFVFYSLRK